MKLLDVVLLDETTPMSGREAWELCKAVQHGSAYGLAVYAFAEKWADLMEAEIAQHGFANLGDFADATSHEADTEGITGYMYGCAVRDLSHMWAYGCVLRLWHNAKYGESGEQAQQAGGVINPAILVI